MRPALQQERPATRTPGDRQPLHRGRQAHHSWSSSAPLAKLLLGSQSKRIDSASFRSLGSCIEQVERSLPPELGVVLPDYYDVPDAICRMRQALTQDNPQICNQAVTHTLCKGCATTYAISRKRPDSCPLSYSAPPRRAGAMTLYTWAGPGWFTAQGFLAPLGRLMERLGGPADPRPPGRPSRSAEAHRRPGHPAPAVHQDLSPDPKEKDTP